MTAPTHPGEQSVPERVRLLVVVAVRPEADAVLRGLGAQAPAALRVPGAELHRAGPAPGVAVDVLAGGVGPAAAAAAASAALAAHRYDLVVSAGIGGGFAPYAPVGATVVAERIVAADLGAETPEGFASVTELGFGTVRHTPAPAAVRLAAEALDAVPGTVLTVSTVTGSAERAAALAARHPGAVAEAMEGFGVAEAAARHGVPAFELRTVSNPVGPRDRAAWRIGEALAALERAFGLLPYPELCRAARADAEPAAPDTTAPETVAPETVAPETAAPETAAPDEPLKEADRV